MASPRLGSIDFGLDEFEASTTSIIEGNNRIGQPLTGRSGQVFDREVKSTLETSNTQRPDSLAHKAVGPVSTQGQAFAEDEPGRFMSTVNAFLIGAADVATDAAGGIAVAQEVAENKFRGEDEADTPIEDRAFYRFNKDVDEWVQNTLRVNPEYQDSFLTKASAGLGSALSFVASAVAGGVATGGVGAVGLPMLLGAASASTQTTDELIAAKKSQGLPVTEEDFNKAAGMSAVIGLSEGIPIFKAANLLNKASGGQFRPVLQKALAKKRGEHLKRTGRDPLAPQKHNVWAEMGKGAIYEGVQEAVNTLGMNWIAKDYVGYDPDRGYIEGTGDALGVGGAVGSAMNGVMALLGNRKLGRLQRALNQSAASEEANMQKNIAEKSAEPAKNPSTGLDFTNTQVADSYKQITQAELVISDPAASEERKQAARETVTTLENGLKEQVAGKQGADGKTVEVDPILKTEVQAVLDRRSKFELDPESPEAVETTEQIRETQLDVNQNIASLRQQKIDDMAATEDVVSTAASSPILQAEARQEAKEAFRQRVIDEAGPSAIGRLQATEQAELQAEIDGLNPDKIGVEELALEVPGEGDSRVVEEGEGIGVRELSETDALLEGRQGDIEALERGALPRPEVTLDSGPQAALDADIEAERGTLPLAEVTDESGPQTLAAPVVEDTGVEVQEVEEITIEGQPDSELASLPTIGVEEVAAEDVELLVPASSLAPAAATAPAVTPAAPEGIVELTPAAVRRVNKGALQEIAENEGVEVGSKATKQAIADAINAKRAEASATPKKVVRPPLTPPVPTAPVEASNDTADKTTKRILKGQKKVEKKAKAQPQVHPTSSPGEADKPGASYIEAQRTRAIEKLSGMVETRLREQKKPESDQDAEAIKQLTDRIEVTKAEIFGWDTQLVKSGGKSIFKDDKISERPDKGVTKFSKVKKAYTGDDASFEQIDGDVWRSQKANRTAAFEKVKAALLANGNSDVDMHLVEDFADIDKLPKKLRKQAKKMFAEGSSGFFKKTKKGQSVVIHSVPNRKVEALEWTMFHEVVGHYGMSKMFAKDWDGFLSRTAANREIATEAYNLRHRWPDLNNNLEWRRGQPAAFVTDENGRKIRVNRNALNPLIEEHIAEIAGTIHNPDIAHAVLKKEASFMNRVVAWVKHILRKSGFGRVVDDVTSQDLLALVGESYIRTIGGGTRVSPAYAKKVADSRLDLVNPIIEQPGLAKSLSDAEKEAALRQGADINEINSIENLVRSGAGELTRGKWRKRMDRFGEAILSRTPAARYFTTYLGMTGKQSLQRIRSEALGRQDKAERLARQSNKVLDKMSQVQKDAVFQYFKTKDANINMVPGISAQAASVLEEGKATISDLGQRLVDLGMLSRKVYEENDGSYLPTRYLKYIETHGGKRIRTSPLNYLRKQTGVSVEDKKSLGQIKDPQFIVPETLAVIGRDVAMLEMAEHITQTSIVRQFGWTMGALTTREFNGKAMDVNRLREAMDDRKRALVGLQEDKTVGNAADEVQLQGEIGQLQTLINDIDAEVIKLAEERAKQEGSPLSGEQFLQENYKKMPDDKKFGALRGMWVHPDLSNELRDAAHAFDPENAGFGEKVYDKLKTAHMEWKRLKVPGNPSSWIRNGFGNLVLLDLSTNTNSITMSKYTIDEIRAWTTGNDTKYTEIAKRYGAFGSTMSAAELQQTQNKYGKELEKHLAGLEAEMNESSKAKGYAKSMWMLTSGKYSTVMEYMSNVYGGLEGVFKSARIRDHITLWEKANGQSFDQLDATTREAVEAEAVRAANEAIFDYSDVPQWLRQARQSPLGAPFMTFMYKTMPMLARTSARHPQKFIKYAILPYVLAHAATSLGGFTEDELEQYRRTMPEWARANGSAYLLPAKSADNKPMFVDFSYVMPWAPFVNAAMHGSDYADVNGNLGGVRDFFGELIGGDLGLFGGPASSLITAYQTNIDSFTGREIVRTGASEGEATMDWLTYLYGMWAPTLFGPTGGLSKLLDQIGDPEVDESGQRKMTPGLAVAKVFGVNAYQFDPAVSHGRNLRAWQRKEKDIKSNLSKVRRDRNLSGPEKQMKIREINQRLKLLREKRAEFFRGGS